MKKKTFLVSALSAFLLVLSACNGAIINSSSSESKSDSSASSSQPTTSSGGGGGGSSSIAPSSSDEPTSSSQEESSSEEQPSSSQEESSSSESGSSSSEVVTQYTITFASNGGTGIMEAVTKDKGETYSLPECGFTKEGYDFDYWTIGNESDHRAPGYEFTVNGDATVTANWKEKPAPAFTPCIYVSSDNWSTKTKIELEPGESAGAYGKSLELKEGDSLYAQVGDDKYYHWSELTILGDYCSTCLKEAEGDSHNIDVKKTGEYVIGIFPDSTLMPFSIASLYDQEDYVVFGVEGSSAKSLSYDKTLGAFIGEVTGNEGAQVGVKIGTREYYDQDGKMYLHNKESQLNNLKYENDKYTLINDVEKAQVEVYLGEGGAISVFLENQTETKYYAVGKINGVDKWTTTDYELKVNPANNKEYVSDDYIPLKAGDGIKAMNIKGYAYYPAGSDTEYKITEDGSYKVYFRPDGQGGEGWYEGYLYVQKQETPVEPEYSKYEVVINGIATELVEYEYVLPEVKPADVKAQYYLGEDNVIGVTEGNSIVFKGYKESAYEELPAYTPNGDDMTNHIYNNVIEEGGVLKIRRTSAEAKVYLILHTDDSYSFWISEGGAMAVLEDGYYITGTMNGWAPTAAYKLNESGAITVALHQGDQFLIVQKDGDNMYYYKNIPADSGSDKATTYKNGEGSALYNGYILALEDHNFQVVVPGSYFIEYAESGIWTELWYLDPEHKDTSPLLLDKLQVAVNEGEYADIDKFGKVGENIQYEYTANITKDAIYHFRWASGEAVNLELGNTATPFFTLGGDGSYVVAKSSVENVTFYFVLSADKITLYASIPAGPSVYALVGTMNGWDATDTTYAFTPTGENEVSLLGVSLSEANKFKVVIDGTWTGCLSYEHLSEATKALKINEEFAFLDKDGNDHNIEVENSRIYNIVINTESGEITITVVQVTITRKASNEGEATEIKVDKGQNYVLPANPYDVPAGKKFEGWTIGEATRQPGYVLENVQEDVLMVALWAQLYTVSFNANDGTGTMEPVQVEAGDYELPACDFTAPEGKQFKAWQVGENQYQPGDKVNIEDTTEVTAVWMAIPVTKYTVTYKANGGTGSDVVVNDIAGSYQLVTNTFEAPENKAFKCWSVGGVEKAVGAYIDVEANTEVLAVWEDEYTITFDGNGGTSSMAPVKQVAGKYTLPENGFTAPAGYEFAGWKIGEEEGSKEPGEKIDIAGNVTIKALWNELPPEAPEKSVWVGRAGVWSKLGDLVANPNAAGELMALNVALQEGDEFVIRVLGDNYIKTITMGGAKDDFTFDGESNIVVKEGKGGNYNFYVWGENNTKLSIEKALVNTGIKAYYNATYYDESHSYVFVGDKVTTNGYLVIKYVRDDLSEVEISGEDYGNVKYYINEACTQEADLDYIFTAEEHNHDMTAYVKLGDFKTSFSFTVIYKNYVHHQSGAEWVDTPLTENMFEHKVALIHLDNADKFAVRTLGTWVSGLEGDYYPNGAYTQEGDLYRNHYSSIWNGSSDVQKVTGIMYDVSWLTTVAGDYVIGVREGDSGVIVYRTNWTVTLKRGSNDPVVLVPTATLTREYQFERVELQEGDIITIQRGDIKYGYNYYNGTKSFYECFNKDGAIGNFAGYDGENSWVVKAGCSGIYSFYLKPEMVYYSQSKQFSVTVSPSIYIVKEDLWYYTKGSAEPVEMNYDPYDSSNSVILPNIDLEEDDTISFNDAVLSNIGYSNISNAEQKALFTEGENNKLIVKEAGAYTFHIVRATGAITVDYASKTAQGGFKRGTNYVVGSADFHSGTSSEGESWNDVEKAFVMVLSDEDKPENCEHQYKATITFKQNDEWMIRTNIYWPYAIENAGAFKDNLYMELTLDGNIKVNRAGKYEIYLKTNADGYWSLYVSEPKDFTPDQSNVSMAIGNDVDVFVSYATGAEFETLTAVSNKESIATTDVNIGLKRIRIHGVAAGETFVTISDGKTDVIINVTVYGTYAVTFEMDLDGVRSTHTASNCSLYVFGNDDYVPQTWEQCAGNVESGKVIFTIPDGKDITGAVFYFVENEVQKQSKDIAVNITAEGTYIVTFVDHWEEVEKDVWKLDEMTIAPKALKLNKDEVTLEKGELDNSVIASDWMGELSVISDHPEYATAVIDNKGTVTITGVGVGEAVITVSDGITNRDVTVTVTAPVAKYAVKFEMDLSVVKSWDKTSNFSLYVFGNDKYQPKTWDECANNIDSGSVTFNILEGKDITGAVFYFEQDGELKQSTDMAVTITEAGTYTVNFVNHWDKFIVDEKEVWKLDEMTITQKVLTVNKNALTIEKEEVDESVVASNWVGPLTATSNQPDVASVTIDAKSGVATITGNGIGDAVITISDGTTNKVVNVTVAAVVEKYTVTYQANGGTGADVVVNDIVGSYQLKNVNPFAAPEGKQFKAWKVGETEYALGAEITVGADTVVKAVWEDVVYTVDVWTKFSIADAAKPVYAWVWTNDKDGKFYECVHVSESWEAEYNRHYTMTFSEVPTGKNIIVVCFSSVTDDNPDWNNELSRSGDCIIKTGGSHGYQIDTYNDLKP